MSTDTPQDLVNASHESALYADGFPISKTFGWGVAALLLACGVFGFFRSAGLFLFGLLGLIAFWPVMYSQARSRYLRLNPTELVTSGNRVHLAELDPDFGVRYTNKISRDGVVFAAEDQDPLRMPAVVQVFGRANFSTLEEQMVVRHLPSGALHAYWPKDVRYLGNLTSDQLFRLHNRSIGEAPLSEFGVQVAPLESEAKEKKMGRAETALEIVVAPFELMELVITILMILGAVVFGIAVIVAVVVELVTG